MAKKYRIVTIVLLASYTAFIVYKTLLCRTPTENYQYNFQPFWSYIDFISGTHPQIQQIVLNIFFFIPFGILMTAIIEDVNWRKKVFVVALVAMAFSVQIEILQLCLKLGMAEFDDVFDNTIGAVIGAAIIHMVNEKWGREMHKPYGPYEKYFKRPIDFCCAFAAIIVFSWLYIILMILGAIFMRGNPFFTQERPGKDGKIFKLIKFRSMDGRKDKEGNLLPDEVRLNKYGRLLRATSLDELPEAINILKGDMSVIGPRPLLVKYLPLYNKEQMHRHDVRPGLSGYAQVHGRNTVTWEDKFAMDVWYANHITFLGDVKIIIDSVLVAFVKRDGISSETSVTMEEFKGTPVGVSSTWRKPQ